VLESFLKCPASSLFSKRKVKQSITPKTAQGFARVRFVFSTQAAKSNARFRSAARIEIFDAMIRVYDQAGTGTKDGLADSFAGGAGSVFRVNMCIP
jgi:hypothetical protein